MKSAILSIIGLVLSTITVPAFAGDDLCLAAIREADAIAVKGKDGPNGPDIQAMKLVLDAGCQGGPSDIQLLASGIKWEAAGTLALQNGGRSAASKVETVAAYAKAMIAFGACAESNDLEIRASCVLLKEVSRKVAEGLVSAEPVPTAPSPQAEGDECEGDGEGGETLPLTPVVFVLA